MGGIASDETERKQKEKSVDEEFDSIQNATERNQSRALPTVAFQ